MIALACDHAARGLKEEIKKYLDGLGLEWKDFGTYTDDSCNYPEFGYKAAKAVASGECDRGIICCGTGVGISLAANKVEGIRCVVCSDVYSAVMSRRHNNTNMLSLGARVVGTDLALMIVQAFLDGEYEGGRHQIRVDMLNEIDKTGELKLD